MTDRFPKATAALGLLAGTAAALLYHRRGLTLSHYDAKAHLVVARRILDSLTPEYSQIGAVWLPLPHVLNLLPVQIDAFYRTGASGVAISVLSFALACYAIARLVLRTTQSRPAAAIGVAMFALDPNILYLQSTPMTEPLLLGLTLLAVSLIYDWIDVETESAGSSVDARVRGNRSRAKAGWCLVAACLTRYEAWFVTAAVLVLAVIALWRLGRTFRDSLESTAALAAYPLLAILCFFFHSWFTTGDWFVTGGFFVPDNIAFGRPHTALMAVIYGMRILAGAPALVIALAGVGFLLWRAVTKTEDAASLVVLALIALMVLPAYAFYKGHPFRMRYMIVPTAGAAVFVGIAVGMLRGQWRRAAVVAAAAWLLATARPADAKAPMVQEAQWDRPFSLERRAVTACLMRDYHGEPILASMGSLAHYMQELSREGINIRDFVHEGNLPFWQEAIEAPRGLVGWILVEERAEGGDRLAARTRESSDFLTGFTRVCAGGGVVLYRKSS